MTKIRAAIAGTGSYVPQRILANADLQAMVDTSDEWIRERTGIRERRIAAPDETTSTMATAAAKRACQNAGIDPADIDLIIVATVTPDHVFPSTACLVQHALGAKRAAAFDLEAACSGFMYALSVATGMIMSRMHQNVLVIGAETLSRIVDYTDRGTCILFGDGAGAALLTAQSNGAGILYSKLAADGGSAALLQVPAGGSKMPASCETVSSRLHYMKLDGRRVFKFATTTFIELVQDALQMCEISRDDVTLVIPHQVNERIIEAAIGKLDIPPEKFFINIDRYGNTSAASVPIALDEARRQGRLNPGDIAILLAFGAGLTWGSAVVRM